MRLFRFILGWGLVYAISIWISNYVIGRLMIVDPLLVTLFTAILVSIVAQAVRSHEHRFKLKWFIFFFLVYANIIFIIGRYLLPKIGLQNTILSGIIISFIIAGVVAGLQKINMKHHSAQWISIVLVIILLASNLGSLHLSPLKQPINSSELSEDEQACPRATVSAVSLPLNPELIGPTLSNLIDTSIWQIERSIGSCYKGKYPGQYPDWFYCDNMIVSRFETGSSGTIRYRWYTAVTAEWKPNTGKSVSPYIFSGFSCENGQKVTVDKGTTKYYVYDSRDGTEIKIAY